MKPRDGDYVVINSQWSTRRYDVRRITKLTAQMYFYDDMWAGKPRPTRARLDEILFATPDEEAAKRLSERLRSSDALKDEEQRKASERWTKRNSDLIEAAEAALSDVSEVLPRDGDHK